MSAWTGGTPETPCHVRGRSPTRASSIRWLTCRRADRRDQPPVRRDGAVARWGTRCARARRRPRRRTSSCRRRTGRSTIRRPLGATVGRLSRVNANLPQSWRCRGGGSFDPPAVSQRSPRWNSSSPASRKILAMRAGVWMTNSADPSARTMRLSCTRAPIPAASIKVTRARSTITTPPGPHGEAQNAVGAVAMSISPIGLMSCEYSSVSLTRSASPMRRCSAAPLIDLDGLDGLDTAELTP
jgi:hypothetical protein